jgi:hypothetical protein
MNLKILSKSQKKMSIIKKRILTNENLKIVSLKKTFGSMMISVKKKRRQFYTYE